MNRTDKLKLNTIFSLINKIVIILSGFVLPRLILSSYGSEVNGLVTSITQFLNVITFLDLGVGSVVQSALYRPLAKKNNHHISAILTSANKYFRKIAYILVIYVLILIFFYPLLVENDSLSSLGTGLLIFAISINIFAQYYFAIVNELFLNANQKSYIQLGTEILIVILNLVISTILILSGTSIFIVKMVTGIIYLIRPLYLDYYVNKHYNISKNIELQTDPLPQKWNGMAQHIAYSIQNSTDVVILTTFSTLENVSIYSVYNLIASGLKLLVESLTTGLQSFFGGLLAENKKESLIDYFDKIEWLIHNSVVFLYAVATVLIVPFVAIYTSNVSDANYYAPVFATILLISQFFYSIRTPYQTLVFAAGNFKETQFSSIIEAALNVGISILLVNKFGLIGVSIGSLSAIFYRTLYLVFYLSKNITNRPILLFFKQLFIDCIAYILIVFAGNFVIPQIGSSNFFEWVICAISICLIAILILIIINSIFYNNFVKYTYGKIKRI
ncbi:lipopolysaccharide biosynthesis protein [Aerococcus viridans]|uniref:lipopolysaccharide biosynthesis protein n=1 Tax=Aerococcus viridans TaxID=1377 RepID=UPI003B219CD8